MDEKQLSSILMAIRMVHDTPVANELCDAVMKCCFADLGKIIYKSVSPNLKQKKSKFSTASFAWKRKMPNFGRQATKIASILRAEKSESLNFKH